MTASIARLGIALMPDLAAFQGSGFSSAAAQAGLKFGEAWSKAFLDKTKAGNDNWMKAFTQDMEAASRVANRAGQLAAGQFIDGLGAIKSGNFEQLFAGLMNSLQGVTSAFGGAGKAALEIIPGIGPMMATSFGIATDAMQTFIGVGGEYVSLLTEIGDKYLAASRTLAGSLLEPADVMAGVEAIREIMASGAVDHFEDVEASLGRFQRALNLSGEDLKDFTAMYASAVEIVGNFDPTNTAGIMRAFGVDAKDMAMELQTMTNIIRGTGGEMGRIQDQMIRSGPAFRSLGYDLAETALFFGRQIEEGERGTKLVYGINQMVDKINKQVMKGSPGFADLHQGWETVISDVKKLVASGQELAALEILGEFTTPTNATLWLEEINRGILDIPGNMREATKGYNQNIQEMAATTTDISGVMENISQTFESALMPIGGALASGLVDAGNQVVNWMSDNQRQMADWAADIANVFIGGAGAIAGALGGIMTTLSGVIDQAKYLVVGAIGVMVDAVRLPLDALAKITPDWLGGDAIRGISGALNQVNTAIDAVRDSSWSESFAKVGDVLTSVSDAVPGLQDKLTGVATDFAARLNIGDALKADLDKSRDGLEDVFEGLKKQTTAAAPMLQLLGTPTDWAKAKQNMAALGLTMTVDSKGVVTAVSAANEAARKSWEEWFALQTKKDLKINVQPYVRGKPANDTGDLLPPGSADVTVNPSTAPGAAAPGAPAPTGPPAGAPSTPFTGGVPFTGPPAGAAQAPAADSGLRYPTPYLPGTGPSSTTPSTAPSTTVTAPASVTTPTTINGPADIAKLIYSMAVQRGYSDTDARAIVAYAVGESGLNPTISGGVQRTRGDTGPDSEHIAIGLFQQKPAFAREGGIDPSMRGDPVSNITAYLNQLEKYRNLPMAGYGIGNGALASTSRGGPLAGTRDADQAFGPLLERANNYLGTPVSASNPIPVTVTNLSNNLTPAPAPSPFPSVTTALPTQTAMPGMPAFTGPPKGAGSLPVVTLPASSGLPTPPAASGSGPAPGPSASTATPSWANKDGWGYYRDPVSGRSYWIPSGLERPSIEKGGIPPKGGYEWQVVEGPDQGIPVNVYAKIGTSAEQPPSVQTPTAAPPSATGAGAAPASDSVPTDSWHEGTDGWKWWQDVNGFTYWVAPGVAAPSFPKNAVGLNATADGYWTSARGSDGAAVMVFIKNPTAPVGDAPGAVSELPTPPATPKRVTPPSAPSSTKPSDDAATPAQTPSASSTSGVPYVSNDQMTRVKLPTADPSKFPIATAPGAKLTPSGQLSSDVKPDGADWAEKAKRQYEQRDRDLETLPGKIWDGVKAIGRAMAAVGSDGNSLVAPSSEPRESVWSKITDWIGDFRAQTGGGRYAVGGPVFGAGSATSDSIPAWLSNGEFVQKADAVDHYGIDFMHAVNTKQLPKFATGGYAAHKPSLGDEGGTDWPESRGLPTPFDPRRAKRWWELTKDALGFSDGGEVDNDYSSVPFIAGIEWLTDKLGWIGDLGSVEPHPSQRPPNKSGLLGGSNGFANGGPVRGFDVGGEASGGGTPSGSLEEWLKAQGLDPNKPALTWEQLQAAAATGPKAPTIGLPSGGTITPNASKSNSLGLGPTPNVNAAPGARAQQNLTDFSAGVAGSAQSAVEGTIAAVQDPVGTAKALAPLVGAGGEGAPGVAEAWTNVGKGLIHYDEWEDNPFGAAGGVTFDIGTLVYGPAAAAQRASMAGKAAREAGLPKADVRAAQRAARESTLLGSAGKAIRESAPAQAISKPIGAAADSFMASQPVQAAVQAANLAIANAQARAAAVSASLAPAMDILATFGGGSQGLLAAMAIPPTGKKGITPKIQQALDFISTHTQEQIDIATQGNDAIVLHANDLADNAYDVDVQPDEWNDTFYHHYDTLKSLEQALSTARSYGGVPTKKSVAELAGEAFAPAGFKVKTMDQFFADHAPPGTGPQAPKPKQGAYFNILGTVKWYEDTGKSSLYQQILGMGLMPEILDPPEGFEIHPDALAKIYEVVGTPDEKILPDDATILDAFDGAAAVPEKTRVHEVAKSLGVTSKALIDWLYDNADFPATASTKLPPGILAKALQDFAGDFGSADGDGNYADDLVMDGGKPISVSADIIGDGLQELKDKIAAQWASTKNEYGHTPGGLSYRSWIKDLPFDVLQHFYENPDFAHQDFEKWLSAPASLTGNKSKGYTIPKVGDYSTQTGLITPFADLAFPAGGSELWTPKSFVDYPLPFRKGTAPFPLFGAREGYRSATGNDPLIGTPEEVADILDQIMDPDQMVPDADQQRAIYAYSGPGKTFNEFLRHISDGIIDPNDPGLPDFQKAYLRNYEKILAAMEGSRLPRDVFVQRMMGDGRFFGGPKNALIPNPEDVIGKTYKKPGFLSGAAGAGLRTAYDGSFKPLGGGYPGQVAVAYVMPEGGRGIWMAGSQKLTSFGREEWEMLGPPGAELTPFDWMPINPNETNPQKAGQLFLAHYEEPGKPQTVVDLAAGIKRPFLSPRKPQVDWFDKEPPKLFPQGTDGSTYTGGAGGSHGAQIHTDASGKRWVVKPQDARYHAEIDLATAKIQAALGLAAPETHLVPWGNSFASIQEMFPGGAAFTKGEWADEGRAGSLKTMDLIEIQKNQMFDWLVGNHDSHADNWVRTEEGRLAGIDKGQGFKWYGMDLLEPDNHLNNTPTVYKQLMQAFMQGKATMLDPTQGELGDFISTIQNLDDNYLRAIVKPFAESAAAEGKLSKFDKARLGEDKAGYMGLSKEEGYAQGYGKLGPRTVAQNDVEGFLDAIVARKNSMGDDFANLWKMLIDGGGFDPSAPTPEAANLMPLNPMFQSKQGRQGPNAPPGSKAAFTPDKLAMMLGIDVSDVIAYIKGNGVAGENLFDEYKGLGPDDKINYPLTDYQGQEVLGQIMKNFPVPIPNTIGSLADEMGLDPSDVVNFIEQKLGWTFSSQPFSDKPMVGDSITDFPLAPSDIAAIKQYFGTPQPGFNAAAWGMVTPENQPEPLADWEQELLASAPYYKPAGSDTPVPDYETLYPVPKWNEAGTPASPPKTYSWLADEAAGKGYAGWPTIGRVADELGVSVEEVIRRLYQTTAMFDPKDYPAKPNMKVSYGQAVELASHFTNPVPKDPPTPWAQWTEDDAPPFRNGGPAKFADGGAIYGAGSSRSDSIPAWLSNGEFVQNAAAVDHYGLDFMHALNKKQLPKVKGFSDGGYANDLGFGLNDEITAITDIANRIGLTLTSGASGPGTGRAYDGKYHDLGFAGDFSNGSDNTPEMLAFARYMYQNYGSSISELIYSDPGMPFLIIDGQSVPPSRYGQTTLDQHRNHVHIAIKPGAFGNAMTNTLGSPGDQQLTATTGGPSLAPISLDGTNVGPSAYGANLPGNPWTDMPSGMTPAEQSEYTKSWMTWQGQQAKTAEEVINKGEDLVKAQEVYANAMAAAGKAQEEFNTAQADVNKQKEAGVNVLPDSQAGKRLAEKTAALEQANKTAQDAQKARDQAAGRERDAKDAATMAQYDAPPQAKGGKAGGVKSDKDAEELGAGLVKGIFQGLGFTDDVFGKPFTEWGIWKLFTGGLSFGLNMLNGLGESKGVNGAVLGNRGQSAAYGAANQLLPGVADAIPGAAPGSAIPAVANLIPGLAPPGVDPASSVTPAMATDAANRQGQPANPGASFTSLNFQTNNTGVMGQPEIQANVATSIVNMTRLVPAIGAAPLATV